MGAALGFAVERPDREWKEGPDNLWALDDRHYLLVEAKNEVDLERAEINERETEQMNRSSAWFGKHYAGLTVKCLMIYPAGKIESAAAFLDEVEVMHQRDLKLLVQACRGFFKSFEAQNLADFSVNNIQGEVAVHRLTVHDILARYSGRARNMR